MSGTAGTKSPPLVAGPSTGEVAGLVRRRREEAGLTQMELAQRVGSTQSVVSRWEKGETELTLTTLDRLARALGTTFAIRFGQERQS